MALSSGRETRAPAGRKAARAKNPVSRTSELARRRERRSLRLKLLAFAGLILVLCLAAAYQFWLRDSSLVAVKNLDVVGVSSSSVEGRQIDAAVRSAMGEMTTLDMRPELLEQELARFPRVAGVSIETDFPDFATVTVDMRRDGSIFGSGSGALLIATDGTVLGPAAGQEDSLPLIADGEPPVASGGSGAGSGDSSSSAGDALTGAALKQALVLGAAPVQISSYVTESRNTPEGVEVLLDDGLVLLFGEPAHADQKWRTAVALIADPSFDTGSYVDLTVPRRPAVSAEAPVYEPPAEPPTPASGTGAAG